MATIVLRYSGICVGGPWAGQRVDAERSVIRDDLLKGGAYVYRSEKWNWHPPET